MIRSTFIHAEGIGPRTEQDLWQRGAHSWDAFLGQHREGAWAGPRYAKLAKVVEKSSKALDRRDAAFFAGRLRPSEHWRLYHAFQDRVAFVDIETTGLYSSVDDITVVALSDGKNSRTFVRGTDLHEFPKAIAEYPLMVTFNGSTFDVPFLRTEFRKIRIPPAHIDLRWALGRLGYSGGLKAIERELGYRRPTHLREVDGFEAVRLWRRYESGDDQALETLVAYAAEDVKSLRPLVERAVVELAESLGMPSATL